MKYLVTLLLLLIFTPIAHADGIKVRSGSWGYEYPLDGQIRPDGQTLALVGRRGFTFKGVIGSYWVAVYNCQNGVVQCAPNYYRLNWYTGTPFAQDDSLGLGLVGTATLGGVTYRVGLPGSPQIHIFVYGPDVPLPALGADGKHVVKTYTREFRGKFWHNGSFDTFTGNVLVTVELHQEDRRWEIEAVEYDVVTP